MSAEIKADWCSCMSRKREVSASSVQVKVVDERPGRMKRDGSAASPAWFPQTIGTKVVGEMAGDMQESLSVRHMRADIKAIEAQVDLDRLRRDQAKEKKITMHCKKDQANDVEHCVEGVCNERTHDGS